jgi:hypothetical protein
MFFVKWRRKSFLYVEVVETKETYLVSKIKKFFLFVGMKKNSYICTEFCFEKYKLKHNIIHDNID